MKKQSSSIKMTHLFEPFYTSKEVGKGTGLGLSLIYSIVQNHNGWIDVSSEIDKGTTFRIYLPIHQQEDETTEGLPAIAGPAIRHILLVEDDPVVRKLAGEILKNMGYRVSSAESIQAAEELFARKGEGFDLLFSDILLPDGNGIELAESLRTKRSGLSILLFSGGTDEQINMELIKQKGFAFMNKPFSLNAMLDALRLAVIDP